MLVFQIHKPLLVIALIFQSTVTNYYKLDNFIQEFILQHFWRPVVYQAAGRAIFPLEPHFFQILGHHQTISFLGLYITQISASISRGEKVVFSCFCFFSFMCYIF